MSLKELWYKELTERLSEAFLEGRIIVGVDPAVILFQCIEHLGDEQPLVARGSFDQTYIIRNSGSARLAWEWNLRQLFADALADRPSLPLDALMNEVMALSGIKQPKYYDKVFNLAVDQRIVKTTMDQRGRIVALLIPS